MKRVIALILIVSACVDPYNPPEIAQSVPALIVDGFIKTNAESKFTLSWSQNITDDNVQIFETQATVWIEDEQGTTLPLTGDNQGNYYLSTQSLPASRYRLNIVTANARQFQSDFESVVATPPIDSINWKLTNDAGVAFTISTHDNATQEGFYKWTFEETWEYRSAFAASIIFDPVTGEVKPRTDFIYQCWRSGSNTDILLESTTRLQENRVSEFQLTSFLQNSEKARYKYSILVQQQALTKKAFDYWKQVKQSTENLGTIFGPLPHQVMGNIKCISHPSEIAVGYFSICSVTNQRAFVSYQQLPTPPQYITQYSNCQIFEVDLDLVNTVVESSLLVDPIYIGNGPMISGYRYSSFFCVDCRLGGGTTVKPDYW